MKENVDFKIVDGEKDDAYLFISGNHRVFKVNKSLAKRFKDPDQKLSSSEMDEWCRLEEQGMLRNNNKKAIRDSHYRKTKNLALNINLTGDCNLSCEYCFADGGDYGRITHKMEQSLIPKIFEFIKQHHTETKTVRFEFFGGEPLLNFSLINEIVNKSEQLKSECGLSFIHRISTNLTVLPKGAVELFSKKNFIVSISLDGGSATQNKNRPLKNGKGSFEKIINHCKQIREAGDNIKLVARMTVANGDKRLVEDVKTLWQLNLFDYFQIYPALSEPKNLDNSVKVYFGNNGKPDSTWYTDQFKELIKIYPTLFNQDNRFKGILECQYIVQMIVQGKAAVRRCGAGDTYYTISPDGSMTPCHRLVGEQQYDVDSERKGIYRDENEWLFLVDDNSTCAKCWGRYICGGNCRQENIMATGDIQKPNLEVCDYQLSTIQEVIKIIPKLIEIGKVGDEKLDDMFIACGQPVVWNDRASSDSERNFKHFIPMSDNTYSDWIGEQ